MNDDDETEERETSSASFATRHQQRNSEVHQLPRNRGGKEIKNNH